MIHTKSLCMRGELDQTEIQDIYSYPTSGIDGVVHGTIDYGKKNIFIIGLDFYQSEYGSMVKSKR